jgi:signal transduction histidine kinase
MKLIYRLIFISLFIFSGTQLFGESISEGTKNVLLINSYHQGYTWTDSVTSGIIKTLRQYPNINLYFKSLDAKKFGQSKFDVEKRFIQEKFANITLSGVLVSDNDALDFAFKYEQELFPNVPVVFAGISNPEDYPLDNSRFYGFKETFNSDGIIDFVRLLLPKAKKLLVITDKTTTGMIFRKELTEKQKLLHDFTIKFPDNIDEDSICSMCGRDSEFDAAYYFTISQDKNGKIVDNTKLFEKIRKTSKIPLFSDDYTFLGKGVLGGNYQNGAIQGAEAIKLLIKIMNSPGNESFNRINYSNRQYFFDQNELNRFDISTKILPPGSYIANQKVIFSKSNFIVLIGILSILIFVVVVLSIVYRRSKIAHLRSKKILDKIEIQKNELSAAYSKLSSVISELELTNTQLENTNRDLTAAKKKAEESDNLKSAFLANVSHEIRTPLNSIVGFSSLLNDEGITTEIRDSYIKLIESNTQSLLVLIDEIIDLSKIEAQQLTLKKQIFSVDTLLSELFQVFSQIHKNSKIELRVRRISETKELFVYSDRVRVNEIFTNLLSNAFKFTESGFIDFGYFEAENNEIQIFVRDSGIGIKEEHHQVIFERFRKLNHNDTKLYSGTGLGLAITKKLVELLGGKIWVNSEPGKGTIFFFTIDGLDLKDLQS